MTIRMDEGDHEEACRITPGRKHVVILGGGFGGIYAALEFEKLLGRGVDVDVTLVNRENFFLFTPMLHEVASSDLDMTNIVNPIRKLLRRVGFFQGEVESIDLEQKRIRVVHGRTFNFSGAVAWSLWRAIYLSKLPRIEKKVRVVLDWLLDLMFSKDLVQFQTVRGQAPAAMVAGPPLLERSSEPVGTR